MNSQIALALAIVLEVAGTVSMKLSEGFANTGYSIALFILYILSFTALTIALKEIDVSIAYAIWAGAGTALISLIGVYYFQEPATAIKIGSIGLIIIGVVGLNLSGAGH